MLALALGIGILLGLVGGEGRAIYALAGLAAALAGTAGAALRGHVPAWTPLVLALSALRGWSAADGPAPPATSWTAERCAPLRTTTITGTWRTYRDGRSGWIDAPGRARDAPVLLLEPEAVAPPEGAHVALLPGSAAVPWARGPEGAVSERERRFAACAPVAADELVVLARPREQALGRAWAAAERALTRARAAAAARVASIEGAASRGLLSALLTGERGELAPERSELFARTGTSHLLAISGWHVGLFAALVLGPWAGAARRGRRWFLLRALLLGAFALLAGAEKPIVRAALAWCFAELAARGTVLAGGAPRRPDGPSFLCAAFVLEGLLDPAGLRSLSLTLSYAATLGLMLGTGPIQALLRRPFARTREDAWEELGQGPAHRLARALVARLTHATLRALAASLAAVLATLPLVWSSFGEVAPAGALVTVLVMPPFTALCLVAWLAALLPTPLLTPLGEGCAQALYALLELGDRLPGTPLLLPPRPMAGLVLATVLVFVALRTGRCARAAAGTWGVLLLPWSAAPRGLELHALDVGHGSAFVLRAPGLEALVFDAGSRERRSVARAALLPLLARWEVARPWVVLSHADQDHAGGLERLATRFPLAGWAGAGSAQASVRLAHAWDVTDGALDFGPRTRELGLRLLRVGSEPGNEGSRALEVRWRGERLLLTGDAEERGLVELPLEPGPLRLLLAPHHGSDVPGLGPFLARHPPAEVWISSAERPAIAAELERRSLAWRWTGRDGPLALELP